MKSCGSNEPCSDGGPGPSSGEGTIFVLGRGGSAH